jgi:short-subunit dehydrogenase
VDEKKRIDVAVNNAGYALTGRFEETSMEETKHSLKPISLER